MLCGRRRRALFPWLREGHPSSNRPRSMKNDTDLLRYIAFKTPLGKRAGQDHQPRPRRWPPRCEPWAAHCARSTAARQYERLRSSGIDHDRAVRAALGFGLIPSQAPRRSAKPLCFAGKAFDFSFLSCRASSAASAEEPLTRTPRSSAASPPSSGRRSR